MRSGWASVRVERNEAGPMDRHLGPGLTAVSRSAAAARVVSAVACTPAADVILNDKVDSILCQTPRRAGGQRGTAANPRIISPSRPTARWSAPAAIPKTTAKITNAVSCVSLTTVRNRTTDMAPTRLNARAMLSPMIRMAIAISGASGTRVVKTGRRRSRSVCGCRPRSPGRSKRGRSPTIGPSLVQSSQSSAMVRTCWTHRLRSAGTTRSLLRRGLRASSSPINGSSVTPCGLGVNPPNRGSSATLSDRLLPS